MDIVYRFGKFQTKEREAMVRRYSFFGLIEYRRYGFGGVYLIVGRKWFTIAGKGNGEDQDLSVQ